MQPLNGKELNNIVSRMGDKPLSSLQDLGIESVMRIFELSQSEAYRICILLDRDVMLMHLIEECSMLGIDVTTPFDSAYPQRLKDKLGKVSAPPLFFMGDITLMDVPCVGITGTSGIKTPDMFKNNIKVLIPALSLNGFSLITAGGPGACYHARELALNEGTRLITVANGGMKELASEKRHQENTDNGSELIISPVNPFLPADPAAQNTVNNIIYCQSMAAFVSTMPPRNTEYEARRKKYCTYLYAFNTPENAPLIERGLIPVDDITDEWVSEKSAQWYEPRSEQLSFL